METRNNRDVYKTFNQVNCSVAVGLASLTFNFYNPGLPNKVWKLLIYTPKTALNPWSNMPHDWKSIFFSLGDTNLIYWSKGATDPILVKKILQNFGLLPFFKFFTPLFSVSRQNLQ